MARITSQFYELERKLLLVFGLFVSLILLNVVGLISWSIPCAIKHFVHLECFACGTTEAIKYLFLGNLSGSWKSNPSGIILSSYFLVRILYLTINTIHRS
jgi:hypothetical protein